MEVDFEGGEEDEYEVDSVAIAFFRGHRRIAFFDVSSPCYLVCYKHYTYRDSDLVR